VPRVIRSQEELVPQDQPVRQARLALRTEQQAYKVTRVRQDRQAKLVPLALPPAQQVVRVRQASQDPQALPLVKPDQKVPLDHKVTEARTEPKEK
jgi:hypothetical protein